MEGHAVDFHQEGNRCSSHIALVVQIVQEAPQHLRGGDKGRNSWMQSKMFLPYVRVMYSNAL